MEVILHALRRRRWKKVLDVQFDDDLFIYMWPDMGGDRFSPFEPVRCGLGPPAAQHPPQ